LYGRRILVLIPHPDDEVVGCCAAIGRARQQGAEVLGAYLTTGVPAAAVLWPWQRNGHPARVARRLEEARRAAELLHMVPLSFSEIPTRELKSHISSTRDSVRRHIRFHGIDVLWAPAYEGGHQDHDVANFIASTLLNVARVWEFSEYNFAGGKARSQEFVSPKGAEQRILLTPEEQVAKQKALALYESEKGNLTYVRTEQEVFRPLAAYSYSRPPHSGKLFYQRFQWVPYHPRVDHTKPDEVCRALVEFRAAQEVEK
jgi:LmbE family N-acetylglucosaminyl deacetylase